MIGYLPPLGTHVCIIDKLGNKVGYVTDNSAGKRHHTDKNNYQANYCNNNIGSAYISHNKLYTAGIKDHGKRT